MNKTVDTVPSETMSAMAGALPVMDEVKKEAKCRKITLLVLPTAQAIKALKENPEKTKAILHVTC